MHLQIDANILDMLSNDLSYENMHKQTIATVKQIFIHYRSKIILIVYLHYKPNWNNDTFYVVQIGPKSNEYP